MPRADALGVLSKCPHDRVEQCPLYIASHTGHGLGCDDGRLEEGCAVERGLMDYDEAVEHGRRNRWRRDRRGER